MGGVCCSRSLGGGSWSFGPVFNKLAESRYRLIKGKCTATKKTTARTSIGDLFSFQPR